MTRQLELLGPGHIAAEITRCPRVWLPLGTIEYHGQHLPVGLDGLQAHGLYLDAAEFAGGLVYPQLWRGKHRLIYLNAPLTILRHNS